MLEGREHEEIGALIEPLLAQPNLVHDAIAERQLGHCLVPQVVRVRAGMVANPPEFWSMEAGSTTGAR